MCVWAFIGFGCERQPTPTPPPPQVGSSSADAGKSAAPAPAGPRPVEIQPAETKPTEAKPTEAKPADAQPAADLPYPSPDDKPGPEVLRRTRLATGLVIDELKVGEGAPCLPMASITFHIKGWLKGESTPFDDTTRPREATANTPAHDGSPIEGPISQLLPGMRDGIIGMQAGGKRRLFIPTDLAYGPRGRSIVGGEVIVPPMTDLVYEIELISIRQNLVKPDAPGSNSTAPTK